MLDFKCVPIVINNFNRLSMLKYLLDFLTSRDYRNIFIIDNNSTYPALLKYYDELRVKVFRLGDNIGCYSLWQTSLWRTFSNQYYVFTDPDLIPTHECPDDFIEIFFEVLQRYPMIGKVGFGLKIDDIPDHFQFKQDVLSHEDQFWKKEVGRNLYLAPIDTTFALYRPGCGGGYWVPSIRTGPPYVARHLPWYLDLNNMDEENRFYLRQRTVGTHWSRMMSTEPQSN